jgi:ureidoglycolate hydrolase
MSLIETYATTTEGYHPFLIREGWQVAQLNYIEDQHIKNINKIEVHRNTDEVFVLLKGKSILITVDLINEEPTFKVDVMKPHVTYNIPQNVWHNITMEKGSEVLIIEKSNTHLNDVEYLHLTEKQIINLRAIVKNITEK